MTPHRVILAFVFTTMSLLLALPYILAHGVTFVTPGRIFYFAMFVVIWSVIVYLIIEGLML